ncbi:chemoreceptor glutamine deamidase CheD [Amnimonas aquatica]|uniref:Probable chemoreceptor glutamine deamidase CheD n=1 Tax=Amnimonas aquatica TaxID=2094561 RepID=A0A2P6AUB9_9GAMM|nr:chemoreceptor glutamine deamidase CheD [Amnimonas aquatica]PQA49514.1 chemoreceptor glutamine deamidase CheD [Amnimonas aquatica]
MTRIVQRAVRRGQPLPPGEEFLATKRFRDHQFKCDVIKIMPGEFYVASGNVALATVLGSCVSACIWDPITRIGGMNHFMLAGSRGGLASMRYGDYAMETLIRHVLAAGALGNSLEAKIFGGGRVLKGMTSTDVGGDNIRFVIDYLREQGIPITARDLGDTCARKLYFFPDSGRVKLRRMHSEESLDVVREELNYRQRIVREA